MLLRKLVSIRVVSNYIFVCVARTLPNAVWREAALRTGIDGEIAKIKTQKKPRAVKLWAID